MNAVLDEKSGLPAGWERLAIEDVADVNPRVDKSKISDDLKVSFVPMPAVEAESGAIDVSEERPFSEVKKGFTPFIEGDVLFAKITPCMENGKMAVVPKVKNGYGFGSTEFHVLRPKDGIESKWIYYFVSSRTFRGVAQHNMTGAVGQKRVPTNYLKQQLIPIAPPEQQKRIVAKIEELFSHIDAGIEALKKAKQLLKQYRQSVLKAAVTGELTKDWREANKGKLEPESDVQGSTSAAVAGCEGAAQLLERILKERRQKWEEQQLEQFKAKGKMPKDDKWKDKYKEQGEPIIDVSNQLTSDWSYARLDVVAEIIDSLHKTPTYANEGYPMVRVTEIKGGELDLSGAYRVTEEVFNEFTRRYKPRRGDILISRVGTYGNASLVNTDQEFCLGQNTAIICPLINSRYLHRVLESRLSKQQIDLVVVGSTQKTLSLKNMAGLMIPLPIKEEQEEIAKIVDAKLTGIDHLENELDIQLIKAEKNKQSVLVSAFSGEIS